MKNYLIIASLLLLIAGGFFVWQRLAPPLNAPAGTQPPLTTTAATTITFSEPKKSAHYETNTPAHGAVLAAVPVNVVIDFNFDLAKPSSITILKDGQDYGAGETTIENSKLALRRSVRSDAPDGLYTAEYQACWPDQSCHDGHFQFAVERKLAANYQDQTGPAEVIIRLSQLQFQPKNIKVTRGTKVTWVNDEAVAHYVNSDAHPAHTYYPLQNSPRLEKGDQFSLTFDQPGIYPYHCSAHASFMTGSLLVE